MSEAKKTETKTQAQTPFETFPQFQYPQFDAMSYWTQSQQSFQKMMSDAYTRAQAFAEQYATLEAQMVSRAQGAVANWAQLTQEAIAYGAQLSAEARKISVETMKKLGVVA